MRKNIVFGLVAALILVMASVSGATSMDWIRHIESGQWFQVVFDRTQNKFDDSRYTGQQDPMGTLKGGETYTVIYKNGAFSCTGYNQGARKVGTWSYSNANPQDNLISLWGRPYVFDGRGALYDFRYGLVGRLVKGRGINPPKPNARSIKLFNKINRQSSNAFKANKVPSLRMETSQWDRTPYRMTRPYRGSVTIPRGARAFLSSKPNAQAAVYIDNFFLINYRSSAGSGSFVIGGHEPVYRNGQRIRKVGPNSHSVNVELTKDLPQGVTLDLSVLALDYGGVGGMSNVYLLIK